MNVQAAIQACLDQQDLSAEQMTSVMRSILNGNCTPAQVAGFLIALRAKGETVDEVYAAASVMRDLALRVHCQAPDPIDIVGTGGDSSGTFNVSTASTLVVAGAGVAVAKHGNRSVSSQSGAADLLETAGVNLALNAAGVARCIDEAGVGFMFAQNHHAAMRHAIGPRREMGVRTVFNLLGPLTNPAFVKRQLIGVFAPQWVRPMAEVLGKMGSQRAMVVHSDDGLDELSIAGSSRFALWDNGALSEGSVSPEDLGLARAPLSEIQVDSPAASLAMINTVLDGQPGAARDMVLLNAGAALFVAGQADTHRAGAELAARSIDTGAAAAKLAALVKVSNAAGVVAS